MAVQEAAILTVEPTRIETKAPVLTTMDGGRRARHEQRTAEQDQRFDIVDAGHRISICSR
jgi:hypothetical protein